MFEYVAEKKKRIWARAKFCIFFCQYNCVCYVEIFIRLRKVTGAENFMIIFGDMLSRMRRYETYGEGFNFFCLWLKKSTKVPDIGCIYTVALTDNFISLTNISSIFLTPIAASCSKFATQKATYRRAARSSGLLCETVTLLVLDVSEETNVSNSL